MLFEEALPLMPLRKKAQYIKKHHILLPDCMIFNGNPSIAKFPVSKQVQGPRFEKVAWNVLCFSCDVNRRTSNKGELITGQTHESPGELTKHIEGHLDSSVRWWWGWWWWTIINQQIQIPKTRRACLVEIWKKRNTHMCTNETTRCCGSINQWLWWWRDWADKQLTNAF